MTLLICFFVLVWGADGWTRPLDAAPTSKAHSLNPAPSGHSVQGFLSENAGKQKEALIQYEQGCAKGEADSCYSLGVNTSDPSISIDYFSKACELRSAAGCFSAALLLQKQQKGKDQLSTAKDLYAKACELGEVTACTNWGFLESQLGNREKARELYLRACDKKDGLACHNLGKIEQLRKKQAEARNAFQASCQLGYQDGCRELALFPKPH